MCERHVRAWSVCVCARIARRKMLLNMSPLMDSLPMVCTYVQPSRPGVVIDTEDHTLGFKETSGRNAKE